MKRINRLLNEDSAISSRANVADNQNIELEINDTPKEAIAGNNKTKKIIKSERKRYSYYETKTNKVVGEPQQRKYNFLF